MDLASQTHGEPLNKLLHHSIIKLIYYFFSTDKEDIIFLQAVQTYSQLLTMNKDWNPLGPFESARK